MDAEIGDEGLTEIRKEVAFFDFLEKYFDFSMDFSKYSSNQLGTLEHDVFDYIQFKIDQLKKEG